MSWPKRIALGLTILVFLGVLGGVGTVVGIFWWYGRGVAELDEERLANYQPPQVTRIYARDGTLIGEVFEQRRTFVSWEDIPSHVENAFLAAEDADFYRHEGMDYQGMVRALIVNLRAGEVKQGASTITQQVVKNFMLTSERSLERKVQELILARRLEQALTKQQILELYLNEIFLGHARYGIEEASQYYFGKSVRDIDIGQAALLATLPKAPSRDSPYKNRAKAKERQVWVLQQMVEHGFASQDDAQPFIDGELDLATADERRRPVTGAEEFVDEVERQLRAQYGEELSTLGADVYTTVDLTVQGQARGGLLRSLDELDERQGYGRHARPATKKQLRRAEQEGKADVRTGRTYRAIAVALPAEVTLPEGGYPARIGEQPVFVEVPDIPRARASDKTLLEQFAPQVVHPVLVEPRGDLSLPTGWLRARLILPESAVAVSDVDTSEVLAMVGGTRYERGGFNRVLQAARQPGSSFKPFVYGASVAQGKYTAATIVKDSPEIYEKWKPTNFLRDKYRGEVRLREALQKSINTIAIKLLDDVGFDAVHDFARRAGIQTELPQNLSLALGTTEVEPWEMLDAYGTIARGGERLPPIVLDRVEVRGRDPWRPRTERERVLEAEPVFVLTSMMTSVVQAGTGTKAKALGRPVAGKTGTSADFHDAWFCGFTPQRVSVAWVGFDQPRYLGSGETGGKAAIPVWLAAMEAAKAEEAAGFVPPPGLVVMRIDAASGLRAPDFEVDYGDDKKRKVLDEYFLDGTAPIEYAVPAALPKGDVLLDLYGGAGATSADDDPDALREPDEPEDPEVGGDQGEGDGDSASGGMGGLPTVEVLPDDDEARLDPEAMPEESRGTKPRGDPGRTRFDDLPSLDDDR